MSIALLAAVGVMALSQTFKLAVYSLRDRELRWRYLFSTGGMPSAHSAFTTTLAVSVGLWYGFASQGFAVAAVFASIIVYDSIRLRGTVDLHTRIVRDLQKRVPGSSSIDIPHMVGHSVAETLAGIVVGGGASLLVWALFHAVLPGGAWP